MSYVSPFAAQANFITLEEVKGVQLATYATGMRYKSRDDLLLVHFDDNTTVAGAFTKSTTASANIDWGKKILPHGQAKVLIVNAGNANAFNGTAGEESIERIVNTCSELFKCQKEEIYPSSTGVIGEPLKDNLITDAVEKLKDKLQQPQDWKKAAQAIMTTDTFPKGLSQKVKIGNEEVTITGIIKGSGMIQPNMATMLGYIFTDAKISANILQEVFNEGLNDSFNSITVDSDTSTSDTVLLFATGKKDHQAIKSASSPEILNFKLALHKIMQDLAKLVVKDGEGITKFITVNVKDATSYDSANKIAFSIANSPLVKTAIAGEDANWGRIVMAIGKTEEKVERNKIDISMGNIKIVENGLPNPEYKEQDLTNYMKGSLININVCINQGNYEKTVWTCDLTHEYISINADYRS